MTKSEKLTFERLCRLVADRALFTHYEYEEQFYSLVYRLNPQSEVRMIYEGSLFDLVMDGRLDPADVLPF